MSDYLFGIDQHGLDCDPAAFDGTCGCDFDKAAWVEVDDNMFVRSRTCEMRQEHDGSDPRYGDYVNLYACSECGEETAMLVAINEDAETEWIKPKFCGNCGAKVVV